MESLGSMVLLKREVAQAESNLISIYRKCVQELMAELC